MLRALQFFADILLSVAALIGAAALIGGTIMGDLPTSNYPHSRSMVFIGLMSVVCFGCLYWLFGMWSLRPGRDHIRSSLEP